MTEKQFQMAFMAKSSKKVKRSGAKLDSNAEINELLQTGFFGRNK